MKHITTLLFTIFIYFNISAQNVGINEPDPQARLHVTADYRLVFSQGFEGNDYAPLLFEGAWLPEGGAFEENLSLISNYEPYGESKEIILNLNVPEDSVAVVTYAIQYGVFDSKIILPLQDTLHSGNQWDWKEYSVGLAEGAHTIKWEVIADPVEPAVNGFIKIDAIKLKYYSARSAVMRIQDGNEGIGKVLTSDSLGNVHWNDLKYHGLYDRDEDTGIDLDRNDDDNIHFITKNDDAWVIQSNRIETGDENYNLFIGKGAGNQTQNKENTNNIGIGDSTLYNGTALSKDNIAIGHKAAYSNDSGSKNISIGQRAAQSTTEGNNNISIGYESLEDNTKGSGNLAIGNHSLNRTEESYNNIAIGDSSMYLLEGTGASENIALGRNSLKLLKTGTANIAIGTESNNQLINGNSNISIGKKSLAESLLGNTNISIGNHSLGQNLNNNRMISIGDSTLYDLVSNSATPDLGEEPVAIGHGALRKLESGKNNLALGNNSLERLQTGNNNLAIGNEAMNYSIFGNDNLAIGNNALSVAYDSEKNVAIGSKALWLSTGSRNIGIGHEALDSCILGDDNILVGTNLLPKATNIKESIFMGNKAGKRITSCQGNVVIGYNANSLMQSGDWNTAIGHLSLHTEYLLTNVTALGHAAYLGGENDIAQVGNFMTNEIGGAAHWSIISDGRFKENIQEDVVGLDFINKLRPVSYNYNVEAYEEWQSGLTDEEINFPEKSRRAKAERYHYGFIAQEIEKAAADLGFEFSGVNAPKSTRDHYSVSYAAFTVPLVKAVQELSQKNEDLEQELKETKKEISEIQARLDRLTEMLEKQEKDNKE